VIGLDQHTATVCVHQPLGRSEAARSAAARRCYLTACTQPPDSKETLMSPARPANRELDSLIEEITVDCYDEYEQLTGFQTAFENDATFPCPGTVIGEQVDVLSVIGEDDRHELIATCQRNGRHYEIALLDIDLNADPETSRLIAAYRHWIRA
jgi:hypothetical protein